MDGRARVYNQIGSLTELLSKLHERDIFEFKTLSDIKTFRREYKNKLEKIRKKNEELLKQTIADFEEELTALKSELDKKLEERKAELIKEQTDLESSLVELENPKNWFEQILFFFKKKNLLRRKSILDTAFDAELERPLKGLIQRIETLEIQIADRKNNTEKWVESFSSKEVEKLGRALSVFVENKSLFYGALGEEKVLHELAKLSPEYTVINDYRLSFATPIYRKAEDDRIWSIQLDHIVIGPTGIFLIETKNWSKQSVKNLDLYSPVEQLKRHNFAFFTLLNRAASDGTLHSFRTNWGTKKISPKNVILLINNKPQETYQYVKILSLGEINNYIQNERQIFSTDEVNDLVHYLTEPERSWF